MSDIAWNWLALGVAVVLFAGLAWLSISKKAGFTPRVLIATALGIVFGVVFKGHTDFVSAVGSVWSNAITAIVVPLLFFSIVSSITNLGESVRLKSIGLKTVVFLLLNTATAALITLGIAQSIHLGRGFKYTLPGDYKQRDVPAVLDTIVALFPRNIADSCVNNQVVPIVLFAILIAVAYNSANVTAKAHNAIAPFKTFIDAGNVVLSKATQLIVGLTPVRGSGSYRGRGEQQRPYDPAAIGCRVACGLCGHAAAALRRTAAAACRIHATEPDLLPQGVLACGRCGVHFGKLDRHHSGDGTPVAWRRRSGRRGLVRGQPRRESRHARLRPCGRCCWPCSR